jgi:lipopolysaccharide/colanic/teichoic acid biosynthesis glycosyltransferase
MAKRLFDLLLSGLGLVLLSPLFAVVALLIKLDSPGPVFFRQVRVGRHGAEFRIHKFRTMVDPAQRQGGLAGLEITVGDDPRITRLGGWLRPRRLDELPQLIDVFQGSMSLVGPRPEVPKYVARYPRDLRERVLSVRPGITDPAATAYLDEASMLARAADPEREYVEVVLPAKLALSAAYVGQASLMHDLQLLCRTVWKLVSR